MDGNRILVVDDDEAGIGILRIILELDGFEVVSTTDPFEGLYMAQHNNPTIVLLDIMMPEMNGFELCERIREFPELKMLPIFFVTAYQASDLEYRVDKVGANGIIEKPVNNVLISTLIRQYSGI